MNLYLPFQQVAEALGPPAKPSLDPDWQNVIFGELSDEVAQKIKVNIFFVYIILKSCTCHFMAYFTCVFYPNRKE